MYTRQTGPGSIIMTIPIEKCKYKQYTCCSCCFSCIFESDYKRHIKTKKHMKLKLKCIVEKTENVITKLECECGKVFKTQTGLMKHKQRLHSGKDNIIINLMRDNAEIKELMKEQQKFMIEQQEQYHKQLVDMIPLMCGSTNLITNNNTHIKQKFNLNVFLNEQCKDAINIGDFIKSLQITLDDLNVTREKTLEDSVGNIFLRGLKELDIYKRPIHCTDNKRDIMYIKDEEKWEKDEGNSKLKDTIGAISRKQITTLKEWKNSDPEVEKTSSLKNENFLMTFNHICTPIPEVGEKRIIKTIGKEVHLAD